MKTNVKAVGKYNFPDFKGINNDLLTMVEVDEELECVIKLHDFVQKVRGQNDKNKQSVGLLKGMFDDLDK